VTAIFLPQLGPGLFVTDGGIETTPSTTTHRSALLRLIRSLEGRNGLAVLRR
jgi:hypothetical protein